MPRVRTIRQLIAIHVDSIVLIDTMTMLKRDNGPKTYKGTGIRKLISEINQKKEKNEFLTSIHI